jgi:hypothetical protein
MKLWVKVENETTRYYGWLILFKNDTDTDSEIWAYVVNQHGNIKLERLCDITVDDPHLQLKK